MQSIILAREGYALQEPDKFTVITFTYDGGRRAWQHNTLKAAFRRLGSAISGKLSVAGQYAAIIVTPEGDVFNWTEAKQAIGAAA